MPLNRESILSLVDINIKEITVPDHIPGWGGQSLYIKQLTRGQQDAYYKRRFGEMTMIQSGKDENRKIAIPSSYGHDAWVCTQGICDEDGKSCFTEKDIESLNGKSGDAIGWISIQILTFSGMHKDIKDIEKQEESIEKELKN
jgi:hypothetical protein